MITAFCWAFREKENVTLLIKVSAVDKADYFNELHDYMARLQPFSCRIVIVHGFLPAENYRKLMAFTDCYVNTSRAEGLCLPLMEFMANGVPAIAPQHTAMLDYVNDSANFVVGSSPELTVWPHDFNEKYTSTRQRINWSELKGAYLESYTQITERPEVLATKSLAARKTIADIASVARVKQQLSAFIDDINRDKQVSSGQRAVNL